MKKMNVFCYSIGRKFFCTDFIFLSRHEVDVKAIAVNDNLAFTI